MKNRVTKNINGLNTNQTLAKKFLLDDFWKDCVNENPLGITDKKSKKKDKPKANFNFKKKDNQKSEISSKKLNNKNEEAKNEQSLPKEGKTNNRLRGKNRSQSQKNLTKEEKEQKNQNMVKNLNNCSSLQNDLMEQLKKENEKKERCKQAVFRCCTMHDYYLKQKTYNAIAYDDPKYLKNREEMSQCTFKPKMIKVKSSSLERMLKDGDDLYLEYKQRHNQYVDRRTQTDVFKKNKAKSAICFGEESKNDENKAKTTERNKTTKTKGNQTGGSEEEKESEEEDNNNPTFKPKKFSNPNFKKLFRSSSVYDKRENNDFVLRYEKARKIHNDVFEKTENPRNYYNLEKINNTINWIKIEDLQKKRMNSMENIDQGMCRQNLHQSLLMDNYDLDDEDDE